MVQLNSGLAYSDWGGEENLRQAITCYQEALEIYTDTTNPVMYANCQRLLGRAYQALPLPHYREAIICFLHALRVYSRWEEDYQEQIQKTRKNLQRAFVQVLQNQDSASLFDVLIDYYTEAIEQCSFEEYPEEHLALRQQLSELLMQEDLQRAIDQQQAALREQYDEPQTRMGTLHTLAQLYVKSERPALALQYCTEAVELFETQVRSESSLAEQFALSAETADLYELAVALCLQSGDMEQAFEYVERGKSRTLAERVAERPVQPRSSVPPELRQQFQTASEGFLTPPQPSSKERETPLAFGEGPGERSETPLSKGEFP